jgi:signal transduction histidine kinase
MAWTDRLNLELRDNGIGLPKGADEAAGNGLRNMRRRITDLGGTIAVAPTSANDNGTCIRFTVPLT